MRLVCRGLNSIKQGWFALWGPGLFPFYFSMVNTMESQVHVYKQWQFPEQDQSTEQCLPTTGRVPRCHVYFLLFSFQVLVFIFKSLTILLTVQIQTCKLFFSPQPQAVLEIQNVILNTKTEMSVGGFVKILQIDQSKNSRVLSNEQYSHLQTLSAPSYLKY